MGAWGALDGPLPSRQERASLLSPPLHPQSLLPWRGWGRLGQLGRLMKVQKKEAF